MVAPPALVKGKQEVEYQPSSTFLCQWNQQFGAAIVTSGPKCCTLSEIRMSANWLNSTRKFIDHISILISGLTPMLYKTATPDLSSVEET